MKEKSHRVAWRCYRSGVDALRGTHTRRLDGYRVYSAGHVQVRAQKQADRCHLRHGLADGRQPGKVQHQTVELFRQRAFGLACGYADCNDAARLADDPLHKLLVEPIRSPAPPWPRSPRSRGSRTPWAGAR